MQDKKHRLPEYQTVKEGGELFINNSIYEKHIVENVLFL